MRTLPRVMIIGGARLVRDGLSCALRVLGFDGIDAIHEDATIVRSSVVVVLLAGNLLLEATMTEIQRCRDLYRGCEVLAIVGTGNQDDQAACVRARISAYIEASESLERLAAAIVQLGVHKVRCEDGASTIGSDVEPHLGFRLTPREREVFQFIEAGLSNKEISRELSISTSTVKNHVHNILSKLQLRRRREAFSWASIRARGYLRNGSEQAGTGGWGE